MSERNGRPRRTTSRARPRQTPLAKLPALLARSESARRRDLRTQLVAVAARLEHTDPGAADLAMLLADDLDDRPARRTAS